MVLNAVPFQRMTELPTKFVPTTLRLVALAPAVTELGERLVRVGAGLLMVKVCPLEVQLVQGDGFVTVRLRLPAVVT